MSTIKVKPTTSGVGNVDVHEYTIRVCVKSGVGI